MLLHGQNFFHIIFIEGQSTLWISGYEEEIMKGTESWKLDCGNKQTLHSKQDIKQQKLHSTFVSHSKQLSFIFWERDNLQKILISSTVYDSMLPIIFWLLKFGKNLLLQKIYFLQ